MINCSRYLATRIFESVVVVAEAYEYPNLLLSKGILGSLSDRTLNTYIRLEPRFLCWTQRIVLSVTLMFNLKAPGYLSNVTILNESGNFFESSQSNALQNISNTSRSTGFPSHLYILILYPVVSAQVPGDPVVPKDSGFCVKCFQIKPYDEFVIGFGKKKGIGTPSTICQECRDVANSKRRHLRIVSK
jgi:hypothetical protein